MESPLFGTIKVKKAKAEPAHEFKMPTHRERLHMAAHDEKLHATREWIGGRISTRKHNMIHARANKILKGKR